jgi:hypothetical protein
MSVVRYNLNQNTAWQYAMLHFGVPVLYIIVDLFPEPLIVERYNST